MGETKLLDFAHFFDYASEKGFDLGLLVGFLEFGGGNWVGGEEEREWGRFEIGGGFEVGFGRSIIEEVEDWGFGCGRF